MSQERKFEHEVLEALAHLRRLASNALQFQQEALDELAYQRRLTEAVLHAVHRLEHQYAHLTRIVIRIVTHPANEGAFMATPSVGPVTLTTAGQVATATVQGFDQNGNPMPADFTLPPVTYAVDDTAGAVVKAVDNGDGTATVTAVADGTANLTASATSAEGLALSDSQTITVAIATPPPPAPVLSSIKIAFAT